jgi:hypothetical protein
MEQILEHIRSSKINVTLNDDALIFELDSMKVVQQAFPISDQYRDQYLKLGKEDCVIRFISEYENCSECENEYRRAIDRWIYDAKLDKIHITDSIYDDKKHIRVTINYSRHKELIDKFIKISLNFY